VTRHLSITKRQAKTLLQAANEEGGIIEIKTDIGVIRLIPAVLNRHEKLVDDKPKGYF
jgi:histidinol phosphatase-like PHP family hydrolase